MQLVSAIVGAIVIIIAFIINLIFDNRTYDSGIYASGCECTGGCECGCNCGDDCNCNSEQKCSEDCRCGDVEVNVMSNDNNDIYKRIVPQRKNGIGITSSVLIDESQKPSVWIKVIGNGPRGVLFIPGLGNGYESFNWNEADGSLIEKIGWPRNEGIQGPISKYSVTLSFDPPAYGRSAGIPVPTDIVEYCKIIKDLADKFMPDEYLVVGHSIGAHVALTFQKLYPKHVHDLLLLDPTPDYVLEEMKKPGYYTKNDRPGHLVNKKYIEMINNSSDQLVTNAPKEITIVHFNVTDSDARKDRQIEYMNRMFAKEHIVRHNNEGHHFHITHPRSVIEAIIKIILGAYLWHGSEMHIVDTLMPKPSPIIGNDPVIFATTERWLALVSILNSNVDYLDYGYIGRTAYIGEINDGSFALLKNKQGFIYKISSDGFRFDRRVKLPQHEFVNHNRASIASAERIDNVWDELQKEKIKFIPYNEMAEWIRENNVFQPGKELDFV